MAKVDLHPPDCVACRASLFIKLPCQTSFCSFFFIFFVSLPSAPLPLNPAIVCDSSFYYVYSCFIFFFFWKGPHFQMLAVMVLSQHRVSTSRTVSPRIPVGVRCTGHVRMMCSAVCSAAPHSQFDVGARPHLCMND